MGKLLFRATRKITTVLQGYRNRHLLNMAFKSEKTRGGGMTEMM